MHTCKTTTSVLLTYTQADTGSEGSRFMLSFVSSQKKSLRLCEVNEGGKKRWGGVQGDALSSIFLFPSLSSSPVELQLKN